MHPSVHCNTTYNSQDRGAIKYPLTDEWVKKTWYTDKMEYHSAKKKKEVIPFVAKWMYLEITVLSEVSERQTYDITYVEFLKKDTNELTCRTEANSDFEN